MRGSHKRSIEVLRIFFNAREHADEDCFALVLIFGDEAEVVGVDHAHFNVLFEESLYDFRVIFLPFFHSVHFCDSDLIKLQHFTDRGHLQFQLYFLGILEKFEERMLPKFFDELLVLYKYSQQTHQLWESFHFHLLRREFGFNIVQLEFYTIFFIYLSVAVEYC